MFQTDQGYDFSTLLGYDLVYLSGISVAILPQGARHALLDWLNKNPVRLAYDSNFRPRLWEDVKTAQEVTTAFWNRADICLPSIDDEMALFGETEEQVARRCLDFGKTGALKRGAEGPLSLSAPVNQTYPSAPIVVDTTAAGDSFNGGYLASLLSGQTQAAALAAGHACAAHVVQHRGAIVPKGA